DLRKNKPGLITRHLWRQSRATSRATSWAIQRRLRDPIASELGDPSETTEDPGVTSSDAKAPTERSTTGDDVQATETTLSLPVPAAQSVGASETQHESGVSSLALSTQSTDGGRDGGENLEKSLTGNHGEKAEGRNGGNRESGPDQPHGRRTWPTEEKRNRLLTLSMVLQHCKFQMRSLMRQSFFGKWATSLEMLPRGLNSRNRQSYLTGPKAGYQDDVQFIAKNTVLFRIENDQMRNRVIQRNGYSVGGYVWSPESAQHPPDLSAKPLWVDLRGVPNTLYSHKGLKCLVRAVGHFVKTASEHGEMCEAGHGPNPSGSRSTLWWKRSLSRQSWSFSRSRMETMPKEGNAMEHLIKDLEELTPVASSDEKEAIKISESSKELSKTNTMTLKASSDGKGEKEFMISPSRFSPLQDIDEEEETCLEERRVSGNIVDGKKEKELQVASRSRQHGSVPRQLWGRVTGSKDMSNGGRHGTSKKTSSRKL
ncbi:LOW QUALITY PROTEIN: hypothetical protein HID58_090082, partial [Brassica napus]